MMKRFNITKACREALKIMLNLPDAAHSVEHVVRVYKDAISRDLAYRSRHPLIAKFVFGDL